MLYLVPTPIGNLEDMTLRAIRILGEVDVIACEDTRTSGKLLDHYGITTERVSYHDHNERTRAPQLVERMLQGERVALISDAGTPGISDPGFFLVRECVRAGIAVVPLPGPSSAQTALVGSGLPSERYVFEGFLPHKKGRRTRLEALRDEQRSIVLFESPHRILRTLADLSAVLGADREVVAARELSKVHEEFVRGTLSEVHDELTRRTKIRGEFVVVVAGAPRVRKRATESNAS